MFESDLDPTNEKKYHTLLGVIFFPSLNHPCKINCKPLFDGWVLVYLTLYGYGILVFDRRVAGFSPTDGVLSL